MKLFWFMFGSLLVLQAHAWAVSGFVGLDTTYNQAVLLAQAAGGLIGIGSAIVTAGSYTAHQWGMGTVSLVSGIAGVGIAGWAGPLVKFIDPTAGALIR